MNKLIIVVLAICLLGSILVAGCGLGKQTPRTQVAAANGVLNLWDAEDPTTLDPALQNEVRSAQYILEIFSGLVKLDENMSPVPDIAQSWDISGDGTIYTFHLKKDVKFQNGKALTARDVAYSWERTASPETGSLNAANYLGDILGVNEKLAGKASQISGIKVLDDFTLQVTIDSPKSYFLYKLAYPTAMVMDQQNVSAGGEWWRKPNGSGPFKLGQWTPGKALTLERNGSYYGTPAGVDKVQYQFYTGLPMDLYETGKIDVTPVYTDYIDRATDKSGQFYQDLSVTPSLGVYYVGFNSAAPPFNDIRMRKAFSLAVDKDKIITLVFRDMEKKAEGILPPGMPGYNAGLTGLGYDVNQARQLINEAVSALGYADISKLPPVVFTTYGYGGGVGATTQALIYQWKQNLGIDVQVRQLEPERYFYNTKTEIDQIFDMGWSADYPHPQDFLDILFSSDSNNNYGSYSSSRFDDLISQANRSTDQTASLALYRQAEKVLVDDAACIPISFSQDYLLVKPNIKGYKINPLGFATLDKVTVSPR